MSDWRDSYDAWKLASPYDEGGPSYESVAELQEEMERLLDENDRLTELAKAGPIAIPSDQIEAMAEEVVACSGGSRGTIYAALVDAFVMGRDRITYTERQALAAAERAAAAFEEIPF